MPTIIVQELRFDDAQFAAYCDWSKLSKKRLTSGTFFNFFYAWCGRKKRRERRLKKRQGRFPKTLWYIGI